MVEDSASPKVSCEPLTKRVLRKQQMYYRNTQTVANLILNPNQPLVLHTQTENNMKEIERTCFHVSCSKGNGRNTSRQKLSLLPSLFLLEKQGPDCGETCLAIAGSICLSRHRRKRNSFAHSTHDILSHITG